MVVNSLLKVGTVVLLLGAVAMGGYTYVTQAEKERELEAKREAAEAGESEDASDAEPTDELSLQDNAASGDLVSLAAGLIGPVPNLNEMSFIDAVPWRDAEANRAYVNARTRRCELLIPGVPVKSGMVSRPGRATTIGRIPAITIALALEREAKAKMPTITRTQTEKYLDAHRLVIEPILYHDGRDQVYFGTDCRAAFYAKDRPLVTTDAEPMIGDSVGRFLSLGLLKEGAEPDGRTLLMAFRYEQSSKLMTGVGKAKFTTELLILHLRPDATPENPTFDIFSTTDGREVIHRLESSSALLTDPVATIRAEIRFDKFVMMGMYPARPVVTGIELRSSVTVPTAQLRLMMNERRKGGAESFQGLLDDFDELVSAQNSL